MAPTLDKVAAKLSGKMSIGKIDCTSGNSKTLCNEHGIRGYPTLKFSLDGQIYDYLGGRDEAAIMQFANKMTRPVVSSVRSVDEAFKAAAEEGEDGVAFLAYHANVMPAEGSSVDDKLQASLLTQVFAQVARKEKAFGTFLLLETPAASNPGTSLRTEAEGPFLCRLEENVAPRCFQQATAQDLTLEAMHDFVRAQNVPTVTKLGPHNFRKVGHSGRPIVIGVVENEADDDQVAIMKKTLVEYATHGPQHLQDKYYFGWFDGKKWGRFLEQFDVKSEDLPQIFVLDVPSKTYWQDASYKLNVGDFLNAIENGSLVSKVGTKKGFEGYLKRFLLLIVDNAPWSVVVLVLALIAVFVMIASLISPGKDLRPPYKREEPKPSSKSQDKKEENNAASKEEEKDGETKKDK